MERKPTSIDEHLATVSGPKLLALDNLRKSIRSIVPKAEECISYGMPAFRLDGKVPAAERVGEIARHFGGPEGHGGGDGDGEDDGSSRSGSSRRYCSAS